MGFFTMIILCVGVISQGVLGKETHADSLSINLGWGLAVTMGIYVAGGVSGAHLNPAVTLALAVHRGFPWSKVLPFWGAQVAGAFAGASVTFVAYLEAFDHFDH